MEKKIYHKFESQFELFKVFNFLKRGKNKQVRRKKYNFEDLKILEKPYRLLVRFGSFQENSAKFDRKIGAVL